MNENERMNQCQRKRKTTFRENGRTGGQGMWNLTRTRVSTKESFLKGTFGFHFCLKKLAHNDERCWFPFLLHKNTKIKL
jgi:hypothetical protein